MDVALPVPDSVEGEVKLLPLQGLYRTVLVEDARQSNKRVELSPAKE
jgi:hypothetical protein